MDDGALQALVAVLQADHALHVSRSHLLRGEAERDRPLSDLLAPLRREVSHNLPLVREREKQVFKTEKQQRERCENIEFLKRVYLRELLLKINVDINTEVISFQMLQPY